MPLVIPFPDSSTAYQYDQGDPVGNQPFDQPAAAPPRNMFAPASNATPPASNEPAPQAPVAAPMVGRFDPPETTVTADPGRIVQVIRGGQESYYKLDETGTYHETPESLQNRILQDALNGGGGRGHSGVPTGITTDLLKSALLEKQKPNMLTAIQGLLDKGTIDENQAALSKAQLDNGINPFETILGHVSALTNDTMKHEADSIRVDIDAAKGNIRQINDTLKNLSSMNKANRPRIDALTHQLSQETDKLQTAREKLKSVLVGSSSKTPAPAGSGKPGTMTPGDLGSLATSPAPGVPVPGPGAFQAPAQAPTSPAAAPSNAAPSAAASQSSESIVSKIKASGGDDVFAHRVAMSASAAQQKGRPLNPDEVFDLVGGDKEKARRLAKVLGLKF